MSILSHTELWYITPDDKETAQAIERHATTSGKTVSVRETGTLITVRAFKDFGEEEKTR